MYKSIVYLYGFMWNIRNIDDRSNIYLYRVKYKFT